MSDNLGPLQPRVLDTDFRNFEAVVYQKRKPPLSSEVNLSNKIDTEQTRQAVHNLFPSGWAFVGDIKEGVSEGACSLGDVLTSSSLPRNTFKLISKNKGILGNNNIAWVNGWPILVQGVSSSDENNLILPGSSDMEPPTSDHSVNFVFLEVWRKLITPTDTIYKYGNIQYVGNNPTNDLMDNTVNYETSLRIQIQYRIRVVSDIDIETYPDGFAKNVYAQGPQASPITCNVSNFTKVPGDAGLWRAGSGEDTKESMGTVDGYTYAIPMFAIARRNTSAYHPVDMTNGAGHTLSDYLGNIVSDRPDGLYSDWIVSGDILDMRHRVGANQDFSAVAKDAFNKLIAGKLRTKMSKFVVGGQDFFGVKATYSDVFTGDGVRRCFSNAALVQDDTFIIKTVGEKESGTQGSAWVADDSIRATFSSNVTITSVSLFSNTYGFIYFNSSNLTNTVTCTLTNNGPLIGTSEPIIMNFILSYAAGSQGTSKVPEKFIGFRHGADGVSIATRENDLRLRDSSAVGTVDGTFFHTLQNRGGLSTEQYDFGHQLKYHVKGTGSAIITFDSTIFGYPIIGIASASDKNGTVYPLNTFSKGPTSCSAMFTETLPLNSHIELSLYTGTHFFDTNKQGRAVVNSYEMAEIEADQVGDGSLREFSFDAGNRKVIAVAAYNGADQGTAFDAGYSYVGETIRGLDSYNTGGNFGGGTRTTVTFTSAPSNGAVVRIPVLLKSPIPANDKYYCFYETVPYQGLLNGGTGSTTGTVLAEGPAITTTAGSGAITDYTYAVGSISGSSGSKDIQGSSGTQWATYVKNGSVLIANNNEYVIDQVVSDTSITLKNKIKGFVSSYSIVEKDTPSFNQRNIIDRLPTLSAGNDSSGTSAQLYTVLSTHSPVIETRITNRIQDITKDATIGVNTADRGRSTISMPDAPLGAGTLGLRFENLSSGPTDYKKTYQSYIMDKDGNGQPVLMVVGSETNPGSLTRSFNEYSESDVVDIFELPGRPLIK